MKRIISILLAGALISMLPSGKIKIGIVQYAEHTALAEANQGFLDALADNGYSGDEVEIEQKNSYYSNSECENIIDEFISDKKDLIFAIASNPAMIAAQKTDKIPVLFSASTNPEDAGLSAVSGGNISGTSDLVPMSEQMEVLLRLVPNAKTVAVIYCVDDAENPALAESAESALGEFGAEAVLKPFSDADGLLEAVSSCGGEADALYIPFSDIAADSMAAVSAAANEAKLPVMCGLSEMVRSGGLISLEIDYYKLGYQTGEMAVRYFKGEVTSVGDMPIEYQPTENLKIVLNLDTAEAIGIEIPEDILGRAA